MRGGKEDFGFTTAGCLKSYVPVGVVGGSELKTDSVVHGSSRNVGWEVEAWRVGLDAAMIPNEQIRDGYQHKTRHFDHLS